jgi:hypothetical protein
MKLSSLMTEELNGILGEQGQLAGLVGDRQDDVLMGLGRLEQLDQRLAWVRRDGRSSKGRTEMVGDGLKDGAALGIAGVHEAFAEGLAGGGRGLPDLLGLGRRHEAGLEGDITDHVTMVVEHGKNGLARGSRGAHALAHGFGALRQ